MNRNSKRLGLALIILAMLSIAACTLRTFACIWYLEDNLIYFAENSLLMVANIIVVAASVLVIAIALSMSREPLRADFSSPLTFVPTGFLAIATLIFGLVMLATYTVTKSPLPDERVSIAAALALVCALLTPFSAVHLFLTVFLDERRAKLRGLFALATVLIGAAYASFLYFNSGSPINAPNKLVEQMAYLFASLFFLYEARISLGREMWRGYTAFGLIAALITAYASIPALFTYAIDGAMVTKTVESAVLLLAMSIFIFARLAMAVFAAPDRESDEMSVLRLYAERRESELRDGRSEDGEQISITELIDIPKRAAASDDVAEEADTAAEAADAPREQEAIEMIGLTEETAEIAEADDKNDIGATEE